MKNKYSYIPVSTGKYPMDSIDFLQVMLTASTKARKTFLIMREHWNHSDGCSYTDSIDMSQVDHNNFSSGFKELEQLGIAKKVRKQVYMINPRVYISMENYDKFCEFWDTLP